MADSTAQYTPGPWQVEHVHQTWLEVGGNYDADGGHQIIASVLGGEQTSPTTEANARLIAAAPALLEAAQQATAALLERKLAWDAGRSQGPLVSEGEALHALAGAITAAVAS